MKLHYVFCKKDIKLPDNNEVYLFDHGFMQIMKKQISIGKWRILKLNVNIINKEC